MTQALDAAIRAGCMSAFGPECRHPECQCVVMRRMPNEILHAALPAEPTAEMIEAMEIAIVVSEADGNGFRQDAVFAYRALRAHLLGEDA